MDKPSSNELSIDNIRLQALQNYEILDTPREKYFDEIVTIASSVCEAPIAVVNLISNDRQWFKAEIGIGQRELPLDVSICRYAILEEDMLIINDLALDERFTCNPLITQNDGLRFYAGALIKTPDGVPIGTVCVLDKNPKPEGLNSNQQQILHSLSKQVTAELELRLAKRQIQSENIRLKKSEAQLKMAISVANFGLGEIDYKNDISIFDEMAAELYDLPADTPLTEKEVNARFHPEDAPWIKTEMESLLKADSLGIVTFEHRVIHSDNKVLWLLSKTKVEYSVDENGLRKLKNGIIAVRDITYRKKNDEEKALLVRELYHRVGNLFALATGIVNMSARTATNVSELARAINGRLYALSTSHSLVHAYSADNVNPLLKVSLSTTISTILAPYISMECNTVEIIGSEILLNQQTLSAISLALHELGTNAMKYGAFSNLNGVVKVNWEIEGEYLNIKWQETGGPKITAIPSGKGFGTKLTEIVIQQLKGIVKREWNQDGLVVEISVPINSEAV
jgi:two-component sensor histidine kinase